MSAENASPGHWNDPDMLQLGNGVLTEEEEKTHFSLWAFAKAPLLLGNDLTNMTNSTQSLVMNEDLIKISQDGYGKQVTCAQGCDFQTTSVLQQQVLVDKELYMAVLVVNWEDSKNNTVDYSFMDNGLAFSTIDKCKVMDLFSGEETNLRGGQAFTSAEMLPHGSNAYKMKCSPF